MKLAIITALVLGVAAGSAYASESCKKDADRAVEVREDYKSLEAVLSAVYISRAASIGLTGGRAVSSEHENVVLEITGKIVFLYSNGLKGAALHKLTYNRCVAADKERADRDAKQQAREARKLAAREASGEAGRERAEQATAKEASRVSCEARVNGFSPEMAAMMKRDC